MEDEIVQEVPDTLETVDLSNLETVADDLQFSVGELHDDLASVGDAVRGLADAGSGDADTLAQIAQLIAYSDVLLLIIGVGLFLVCGLLLGQAITRRL